jgi:hypothetical protein
VANESVATVGPGKALRRLQLHELLKWLARRTEADHWYEEDPQSDPYYVTSANACLADARSLARSWVKDRQLDDLRQKSAGAPVRKNGIQEPRSGPARPPLTGLERTVSVGWLVKAEPGVPGGIPVVRVEAGGPLQVGAGSHPRPLRRPALKGGDEAGVSFDLAYRPMGAESAGEIPVTLHGLYRGQRFQHSTLIPVNPQPDVTAYRFPRGGSAFAVRAEPNTLAGHFVIVLDGSPSMFFDKQPPKKYHQATKALREALGRLPRGTTVTIWRFGGGYENQRTRIDRLAPFVWTGSEDSFEPELKNLQSYDAKELGFSPIVNTMIQAFNEDLKGKEGVKTLLVLSDGEDNEPKGRTTNEVQNLLRSNFADSGVTVQFVLFRPEDPADRDKVREQFDCIKEFKSPGRIFERSQSLLSEVDQLQENIKDAMTPKLRPLNNGKELLAGTKARGGFPITLAEAPQLLWAGQDDRLPPGQYEVRDHGLDCQLHFDEGDRLLLRLGTVRNRLVLRRGLLADEAKIVPGDKRRQETDGWVASVLQNSREQNVSLKQLLTLEKKVAVDSRQDRVIEQTWPEFCWIKATPLDGKSRPGPITWHLDPRFPAPTYRIQASAWPEGQPCSLHAWWSDPGSSLPFAEVGRLRVSSGTPEAQEVQFNGEAFSAWVEYQKGRPVHDGPNESVTPRDCLVLTMQTGRHPVWASVDGVGVPQGEEHRYYDSRNYYQAVFWGLSTDRPTTVRLRLLSLEAFQKLGSGQGVHEVRLELDAPDDRPAAFAPVEISPQGLAPDGAAPSKRD